MPTADLDLTVFGVVVADLIASTIDLRHPPAPGALVLTDSITLTTGGNVCNTGIAAAKLGLRTAAAGMVGDDVLGQTILGRLRGEGVDTGPLFVTRDAQTSATVVAVEPGGERVFFHTPGANGLLDAAAFRRCFDVFGRSRFVQIGYFGLLPHLTGDLPNLLRELKTVAPQTKIALDTLNPPDTRERLDPILPFVDLFAPSRTEAEALTGEDDPAAMVASFRRHLPPHALVAIKLDSVGCYVDAPGVRELVPSYKIDVVDTTGAGDTWFAGLLTGILRDMPLSRAAKLANRAAADCCTAVGASTAVQSFDQTIGRL